MVLQGLTQNMAGGGAAAVGTVGLISGEEEQGEESWVFS